MLQHDIYCPVNFPFFAQRCLECVPVAVTFLGECSCKTVDHVHRRHERSIIWGRVGIKVTPTQNLGFPKA